jgi:hypothetical protein
VLRAQAGFDCSRNDLRQPFERRGAFDDVPRVDLIAHGFKGRRFTLAGFLTLSLSASSFWNPTQTVGAVVGTAHRSTIHQ